MQNHTPNWMGDMPDSTVSPSPDSPAYHASQHSMHRRVAMATASELVRQGKISRKDAINALDAWRDVAELEPGVDPRNPYGPERGDNAFSRGRRGNPHSNNGFPDSWQSHSWRDAASHEGVKINSTRRAVYHEPSDRTGRPGPGLPRYDQGGDIRW